VPRETRFRDSGPVSLEMTVSSTGLRKPRISLGFNPRAFISRWEKGLCPHAIWPTARMRSSWYF
jgi:hypothetical protein